jgi:DNA-damage-inducible protein J
MSSIFVIVAYMGYNINENFIFFIIDLEACMKTTTVRARIEPQLKHDVEAVLIELGLSFSEAIELFLRQVKLNKGIPFDIRIPNKTTMKTFENTNKGKYLVRHKNAKALFDKLGI